MKPNHELPAASTAFRRILIAVDKSVTSQWAVEAGGALASRLGSGVVLVHVIDLAKGLSPELGIVDGRIVDELRLAGADALARAEAALPREIPLERVIREGGPAAEIVATARECKADLIVLGTHARSALVRFLLGSTAESVVRHAHCPVLTVGHQPVPPAETAERLSQQSPSAEAVAH
jgi:nucleotide-binding universal stress UspA family protein